MKRYRKIFLVFAGLVLAGHVFVGIISHGFKAAGYRLLQWTALKQHTTLSNFLLAAGAPPSPYKEIYEWDYFAELSDTPLHSAAATGNLKLARSLIEHGASIDWCCCSCVTPLHRAIINKHPEIVNLLLKAGANTRIPYDLSASVVELAEKKGTEEIVAMIVSHNKNADADTKRRQSTPQRK